MTLAPSPLSSLPLAVRWTSPSLNTARTVPSLSHLVSFISTVSQFPRLGALFVGVAVAAA